MKRLRGVLIADPIVILLTIFLGTINILVSFFDARGETQIKLARFWARVLLGGCGIRVRVEGLDQIDPNGSYVFASNHASYMDTPVALASIPVQFRFLAKRGLFKIPFLGHHLSRAGHIPVDREDARAAVKALQAAAEAIQTRHVSLLIFPEGGRTHDGRLQPFREGAAYIAIKAGVPLVPLALIGTSAVLPYGGGVVLSGDVTLKVFPPIATAALTLKDRGALTEHVHSLLEQELQGEAATVSSSLS